MPGPSLLMDETERPPLRIAETEASDRSSSGRVEELIRRLRAAVHKGRDLVSRQDGIIDRQRRREAKLKIALLAQGREIVQLQDRLKEHRLSTR